MSATDVRRGSMADARFGDQLFVRARGFEPFSWLIRARTVGAVNHVACCLDEARIVEAMPKAVQESTASAYARDWWVLTRPKGYTGSDQQRSSMRTFLMAQRGKGYDWPGVFGFDFLFGKDRNREDRWFCSELARAWLAAGDIYPLARLPRGLTSPQALFQCEDLVTVAYNWPASLKEYL